MVGCERNAATGRGRGGAAMGTRGAVVGQLKKGSGRGEGLLRVPVMCAKAVCNLERVSRKLEAACPARPIPVMSGLLVLEIDGGFLGKALG